MAVCWFRTRRLQRKNAYAGADWEARIAKLPVVGTVNQQDPLKPRDLIIGIELNGKAKAYPFASLKTSRAILDSLANVAIMVLLGKDDLTVRVFETVVDGTPLSLFVKNEPSLRSVF